MTATNPPDALTGSRAMAITEFLLARIAEDEAAAKGATQGKWKLSSLGEEEIGDALFLGIPDRAHVERWDPARVLRECEAKRRIVALHSGQADTQWHECPTWAVPVDNDEPHTHTGYYQDPCETLANLAAVYADHPDYDPAWAVP